jgi:chitinase
MRPAILGCFALCLLALFAFRRPSANRDDRPAKTPYVVIAYVGGYRGLVNTDSIEVEKLTHINYAFVDIRDGRAWLHNERTDTINLRRLAGTRLRNPALRILISIGGWGWSKNFSDAVLTDSSRRLFAASAVDIVAAYGLDGIDIDWEYPGMQGDNNVFRPEDKGNYTLLFKALRQNLDSLAQLTHKTYEITTAVGASESFIHHTEMDSAQQYLDYVNVMSYDFKEGGDSLSGHHTNLLTSPDDPAQRSADRAIHAFETAGVPASKLVIGLAFYGHGWKMRSADNHGLFRPSIAPFRAGGFTYIKDSLIGQNGYRRYWDRKARAPWLFQPQEKIFISYDDERSVKAKCKYAEKNRLAGVMFWEYFTDRKGYLLDVVHRTLK